MLGHDPGARREKTPHRVPAEERQAVEGAVAQVKTAMEGEDDRALDKAMETLQTQAHKLSEKLYQNAGQGTGASPPPPQHQAQSKPGGKGDEPVDADYEVVN